MKYVLVVEPSVIEQQYIERMISRLGYRFYTAEDGIHGIRFLKSEVPDILLCSETLPDMSLADFCASVRNDPRLTAIPFLLLSSQGEIKAKIVAQQNGFTGMVTRPISVRDFYDQLETCLSGHHRRHIRVPMEFPVRVTHGSSSQYLETATFGEGGMYIKTNDPIPSQQDIRLSFELPRVKRAFNLVAKVLYNNRRSANSGLPAGMGVQFKNLPEALRMVFGIFLVNHLARAIPMA